jgi:hypothetical protein
LSEAIRLGWLLVTEPISYTDRCAIGMSLELRGICPMSHTIASITATIGSAWIDQARNWNSPAPFAWREGNFVTTARHGAGTPEPKARKENRMIAKTSTLCSF